MGEALVGLLWDALPKVPVHIILITLSLTENALVIALDRQNF